jgi:hypothetical protein
LYAHQVSTSTCIPSQPDQTSTCIETDRDQKPKAQKPKAKSVRIGHQFQAVIPSTLCLCADTVLDEIDAKRAGVVAFLSPDGHDRNDVSAADLYRMDLEFASRFEAAIGKVGRDFGAIKQKIIDESAGLDPPSIGALILYYFARFKSTAAHDLWKRSYRKNDDECQICCGDNLGGDTSDLLLLCDSCPSSCHVDCLVDQGMMTRKEMDSMLSSGRDWFCAECQLSGTPRSNAGKPAQARTLCREEPDIIVI